MVNKSTKILLMVMVLGIIVIMFSGSVSAAPLLGIDVNVYKDNNGNLGERIDDKNQPFLKVGDTFFIEITAQNLRHSQGVGGLSLDIKWDNNVMENLDEITPKCMGYNNCSRNDVVTSCFPLFRWGGKIINPGELNGCYQVENYIDGSTIGLVDDLGGTSSRSQNAGCSIGVNGPERFSLLHFKAKAMTQDSPICINIGRNGIGMLYTGRLKPGDIIIETQSIGITTSRSCSDSDSKFIYSNGNNVGLKGILKIGSNSYSDSCNNNILTEYYCDDSKSSGWNSINIDCSSLGKICVNGACISQVECNDSDMGIEPDNKGKIIMTDKSYEDYCKDEKTLIEYYCDYSKSSYSIYNNEYDCSRQGKVCLSGECHYSGIDPVAYYPFDSDANDYSGNKNNGIIIKSPKTVPGKFGNAYLFNKSGEMIKIPDSDSLDLSKQLTISFWYYPYQVDYTKTSSKPFRFIPIYKGVQPDYQVNYGFEQLSNSDSRPGLGGNYVYLKAGSNRKSSLAYILKDKWQFVTLTYDSRFGGRVYVNGRGNFFTGWYPKTSAGDLITNNEPLIIAGTDLYGIIDELKIWNYSLGYNDILYEYNSSLFIKEIKAKDYECGIFESPDGYLINLECPKGKECIGFKCETEITQSCMSLLGPLNIAYNSKCGDAEYDLRVDFNKDKKIDMSDLGPLNANFKDSAWCGARLSDSVSPC